MLTNQITLKTMHLKLLGSQTLKVPWSLPCCLTSLQNNSTHPHHDKLLSNIWPETCCTLSELVKACSMRNHLNLQTVRVTKTGMTQIVAQPRQSHAHLVTIRHLEVWLFVAKILDKSHGQICSANAVEEPVVGSTSSKPKVQQIRYWVTVADHVFLQVAILVQIWMQYSMKIRLERLEHKLPIVWYVAFVGTPECRWPTSPQGRIPLKIHGAFSVRLLGSLAFLDRLFGEKRLESNDFAV